MSFQWIIRAWYQGFHRFENCRTGLSFRCWRIVWYQTCSDFKVLTSSNTFDGSFIVCKNFVINLWHSSQFQAILKYRRQHEWNVKCLQLQLGPGVELRTVLMVGNLGCGKFSIVPRHFIKIVVEFHIGCRWCCQAQTCNLSMLHNTVFTPDYLFLFLYLIISTTIFSLMPRRYRLSGIYRI